MSDELLERQHQATSKRTEDFRKKGQTMRSRDLTSALVFVIGIIVLLFLTNQVSMQIQANFVSSFLKIKEILNQEQLPFDFIKGMIMSNFLLLMPLFLISVLTALLSPFIFGGWNFSLQSIQFKIEKLNPITNLKNILSKRMFINVAKSFMKVTIIIGVLCIYGYLNKLEIIKLINLPMHKSFYQTYAIISEFIFIISMSLVFIVLFDVISNYFEYQNKIKMTTQELKDELKDTEGNADVKRKLKSAQFALLHQRLSVTVPKADVVITNPSHYAIALKYDANKDKAPKVIAKGKDYIAQQIRRISVSHGITIYEAPLLARALYKTSKLGAEVRPELYMAVAIVLSYVHQLRNFQQGVGEQPQIVSDLQIPEAFIYHE
jgi:flagellar biosynthesis protein FlhB